MDIIDWIVILVYLSGMIALSLYFRKKNKTVIDYYVGGRKIAWWAVGISTMATQTSAISFISIPAFVALKEGGGLTWLQYELGVPIAIIVVMAVIVPVFREMKLVSIYDFLEIRFSKSVKDLVSAVFLISRGLGTAVGVYAIAIILSVCLNLPLWFTILLIGVITIAYDTIGGISAVIYSDVLQSIVLLLGLLLAIIYAANEAGGIMYCITRFPEDRMQALDFSAGLNRNSEVPFWAFLFGGFFLYMSYYGTDQSQVQRELSARSVKETRYSLLFNGLARFPLTLLYVLFGICLFHLYVKNPSFASTIQSDQPDFLVPNFILLLPVGIRGLLFASLLAAAMSSLDSALNSLSAVTVRNFIQPKSKGPENELRYSKLTTIFWGVFITLFALFAGRIADTVIESINKIGSAFYGPILAAFLTGIFFKKSIPKKMLVGIIAGVIFNLFLWLFLPIIHWMWWNAAGCLITAVFSVPWSDLKSIRQNIPGNSFLNEYSRHYLILVGYFGIMLLILVLISRYFSN